MGRERSHPAVAQQSESVLVHQPFRILNGLVTKPQVQRQVVPPRHAAPPPTPIDGEALFLGAVADVTPLHARQRERIGGPAPAVPARPVTSPDAEALAELCDLVAGNAPFDISDSDEHIEGAVIGLDPRLLRRLRAGEFSYQAHIDLHGMTSDQARHSVETFLTQAFHEGKRCVLIVHGRGRNSKDQIPVLKSRLTTWLGHGQWARLVLAFCTARPCDGGAGALYVLLRRHRRIKRPIRVTTGAKW